jgi:hypothetical protein
LKDPERHHYLPEFYQKRWASNEKVKVYRKFNGRLYINALAPKAIGFVRNLYATDEIEGLDRQLIERDVLRRIDNDAARSLRYFENNLHSSDDRRLIFAWTQFLLTLLHRAPNRISEIRKSIPEYAPTIFDEIREKFPYESEEKIRTVLTERRVHEGVYQNLIQHLFVSSNVGNVIQNMNWCIIEVRNTKFEFLTSDKPLMTSNGLGLTNSFLILPVGRNALFVACHDKRIAVHLMNHPPNELVQLVNDAVVRQATMFVIAYDERQTRFIDNRLLVVARQPILDPLNEARWEFAGLFKPQEIKKTYIDIEEQR